MTLQTTPDGYLQRIELEQGEKHHKAFLGYLKEKNISIDEVQSARVNIPSLKGSMNRLLNSSDIFVDNSALLPLLGITGTSDRRMLTVSVIPYLQAALYHEDHQEANFMRNRARKLMKVHQSFLYSANFNDNLYTVEGVLLEFSRILNHYRAFSRKIREHSIDRTKKIVLGEAHSYLSGVETVLNSVYDSKRVVNPKYSRVAGELERKLDLIQEQRKSDLSETDRNLITAAAIHSLSKERPVVVLSNDIELLAATGIIGKGILRYSGVDKDGKPQFTSLSGLSILPYGGNYWFGKCSWDSNAQKIPA